MSDGRTLVAVPGSLPTIIDGVIFDCDGVLVDSERIANGVWARMLTEIGLPMSTEQSLSLFMGSSMARCLEITETMLGHAPPHDLAGRFQATVLHALAQELQPVHGAVALLDRLDAAGVRYAVASNSDHEKMRTTLGTTGLLSRFDGRRFSSMDVARPKPAPDLFLYAAGRMGFRAAHTIVIEDSPLGVRAAAAAGIPVIGYTGSVSGDRLLAAGASMLVENLSALGPLLNIAAH